MFKHMTLAEMTAVSAQLVDKTRRRETFLSIPEVAPLHPRLKGAHNAVLAAQPSDVEPTAEMVTVLQKEAVADARHDHLARAATLTLEAEREHCLGATPPDEGRAAMCERVNSQLFPDGLSCIVVSFLAEAGNTARVAKLLEEQPQIGKFLQTVTVSTKNKKTLLDTVHQWIAAGTELGELEHEREDLAAKAAGVTSKGTIQEARLQWIRVMNGVLANLDLSTAPIEKIEAIRGPIQAASDRAGKRYPGASAEAAEPADGAAAKPANGKPVNGKPANGKPDKATPENGKLPPAEPPVP